MILEPAILLRIVHDQQQRIVHLEELLEQAAKEVEKARATPTDEAA